MKKRQSVNLQPHATAAATGTSMSVGTPEEVFWTSLGKHSTSSAQHGRARCSSAHHSGLDDVQWCGGCCSKGTSTCTHGKVFLHMAPRTFMHVQHKLVIMRLCFGQSRPAHSNCCCALGLTTSSRNAITADDVAGHHDGAEHCICYKHMSNKSIACTCLVLDKSDDIRCK